MHGCYNLTAEVKEILFWPEWKINSYIIQKFLFNHGEKKVKPNGMN